jgi:cytochrome c oxidase subunit 2
MTPALIPALWLRAVPHNFWWLPPDGVLHGAEFDHYLVLNLWIAVGLLLLTHLVLVVAPLRRRKAALPATSNTRLWLVEVLPLAGLVVLFVWLSVTAQQMWAHQRYQGSDPSAMQVEVVGVQFHWYFRYPGADAAFGQTKPRLVDPGAGNPLGIDPTDPQGKDDFVTSQLVLPVGRQVDLRLRSQDVIHGFFIPGMRIKQDTLPGQTLHIHFTPAVPGDYTILCSQLCGMGHYRMQAQLRVLTHAGFRQWLAAEEAAR